MAAGPISFSATALFFDVCDSTNLINVVGTFPAARMLQTMFYDVVRIVECLGGTPVDFNGDGALVLFTGADADDRAVRAALEIARYAADVLGTKIKNSPQAFGAELTSTPQFELSVGVDKGDVCATYVGTELHGDIAWTGRCTHTAARLTKIASHNSVAATLEVITGGVDGPMFGARFLRKAVAVEVGGQLRNVVLLGPGADPRSRSR